ncbi:MAG: MBL fold metallo-hydrolase [Candidatus Brocadia sp.]|uniref:RNA-metabolising metallo-beta-lactamase n=1 Tax=Candidatus Brocadia fulgida TaxID=380242 RepID=A0A0M2UW90_9BACT|nr:MAG: RNA-metabolising metallo-beta-lactamase [Candidatus Brocadia fulgida]UJS21595.1 MAG: MBL fold metallo-hydrolase [Candidatus Brocadia sp.]
MKITFFGAAKTVTGSCYGIHANATNILVDCGFFQGTKDNEQKNSSPFPFRPSEIQYVLLTHAHLDHSGLIPKLVKEGFRGKILATHATVDLCGVVLLDSAHIQERDAEWENERHMRAGRPLVSPLYTVQEAADSIAYFQGISYGETRELGDGFKVRFRDAGHILGSAIVELWVRDDTMEKKLVFSGDLGQKNVPLVKNPTFIEEGDYVFIESTYGNRRHKGIEETVEEFNRVIAESVKRGGNVIIPAFAVGRTQEVLYLLNQMARAGKINQLRVFVDSPMALQATRITIKHPECLDEETLALVKRGGFSRGALELTFTESAEDSKSINKLKSSAIIISASGMCEAGRIRHHLKHNLWRPECSVIFVGFQAAGTLGRRIVEGAKIVSIFGEEIAVKASIYTIGGLSAHADRDELLDWLGKFKKRPQRVFVMHGEENTAVDFAKTIHDRLRYDAYVPDMLEHIQL